MTLPQDTPIQYLKGVGPAKARLLAKLGIQTVEDLLYFFPRRYEDRTQFVPLSKIKPGDVVTVAGKVLVSGGRKSWFTKKRVFETAIGDEHGRIFCVWFNQPYLDKVLRKDQQVVLFGKVEVYKNRLQMVAPEYELIGPEDASLNMGRIVPVYSLTSGITQRYLRRLIYNALGEYALQLRELIPAGIRQRMQFAPAGNSIAQLHFPESMAIQEKANRRISFEEFFLFQISVVLRRLSILKKAGYTHHVDKKLISEYQKAFQFPLTNAQTRVIEEIAGDMAQKTPMLRLLQGDVGSGKTAVAFFGCIAAYASGYQSAVMAPTEILAQQHYQTFDRYFADAPFGKIRRALLISQTPKKEKDRIYRELKEGKIDLVIGTHALLEEGVQFNNLSFVVVDEQHKFGVKQRALLSSKGTNPDVLVMTATPIPRTLCLTLYGDLDISVIDEMPAGRGKITTYVRPESDAPLVYQKVREWVAKKTQAYIIYPIVDESENLDLKSATEMFERFQYVDFKCLRLALIHGQMKRQDMYEIMERFKRHELDILVATTVLEVGIDVPNANIIVIEHANRFGLAQLHQLRGRVGRSSKNAVCILLGDPTTEDGRARLQAIAATTDGFKIAQEDLNIRGPGHYFGRHQHGMNELKIVNPLSQVEILEKARKEAVELTALDPLLSKTEEHKLLKRVIQKRYPEYLSMALAG